ncbi:MAG: cupin domain-containing protein [Pseudomonadota bacterium]|nr:cupin domain-containing protein [Pseudomonadota bacterium]MEC8357294.1 cupin domain-containing protein [Pseudomonadota bacterium]
MIKRRQQFANQQALQEFLLPPVSRLLFVILMSLAPVLSSAQDVEPDELGFIIGTPDLLKPAEGARSVIIYGNPSKPGMYVMQITWPPGTGSRPHFHNTARYINVLKGTWYAAWGPEADVYNPEDMVAVPEGTFIYQPPGGHHYDMAKDEEVIVQIMGIGPVITTSIPQSGIQRFR